MQSFTLHRYKALWITALFAVMIIIGSSIVYQQVVKAAYNGGRIIDNSLFLDSKSMSKSDVQAFLSSKGGQIASRSFLLNCDAAGSQAKQAYLSLGAPCGQNAPASHIIWYSAQVYGISPKVIISTLQKEQSLVTAVNPTDRQYSQAMGYACPTSGNCSDSSNFFWQIDNGTWVLRFHYERARGNNSWWFQSSSWVCGTAKDFYKPNLYPGQNVNFYDENGVMYRTHYIENAATSSLYCYTPHAYNNPQGLYGRAPYGTTGMYYSGSYNFVYFYEIWFGSTVGAPYYASYSAQSPYASLESGQKMNMFISYQNGGSNSWYDDASINRAPSGTKPVHLATARPLNRESPLAAESWTSKNRPALNFSAVYESDGTTLADDQHVVKYGQIAKFQFEVSARPNTPADTYQEYFMPVVEGSDSFFNDPWTYLQITVSENPSVKWNSQGIYPLLYPTQKQKTFIAYKNNGNSNLYDDIGLAQAPTGTKPLHLATNTPLNRNSAFSASWPSPNRPGINFSTVFESDGKTLSTNQHIARPGQIIKFEFDMSAPSGQAGGSYREFFRPILENTADGYLTDEGAFIDTSVASTPVVTYVAKPDVIQSVANRESTLTYTLRNDGNANLAQGTLLRSSNGAAFRARSWNGDNQILAVPSTIGPGQSYALTFDVLSPDTNTGISSRLELDLHNGASIIPGSSTHAAINTSASLYKATYHSQSGYPSFTVGQTRTVYLAYKNDGNQVWYDSTSLPAATTRSPYPIHLATSNSLNRNSSFLYNWPSSNRPAINFSAVYKSDGVTPADNQHVAQPGEIVKFEFEVTPSSSLGSGTYREHFRPISEGSFDGKLNDPGTFLDISNLAPTYIAKYHSQSAYPSLSANLPTSPTFIMYTNAGNTPWFDNSSFRSAPTKLQPVHLATNRPLNRNSSFMYNWPSSNRPAINFSAVYKSDGVTPADNQHVAQPGEIVKFEFDMSKNSVSGGTYNEYFQPILEGSSNGQFPDPWTFLRVDVN